MGDRYVAGSVRMQRYGKAGQAGGLCKGVLEGMEEGGGQR